MSEFKFACPVCGQHITADSSASGTRLDCPTCFRQIVVPQAPVAGDSKLILAAAQANKPRPAPADAGSDLGPLRRSSSHGSLVAGVLLVVILGAGAAALFLWRDKIFPPRRELAAGTNARQASSNAALPLVTYPVPTNTSWTLELTNAVIPAGRVVGRINGKGFRCQRATLQAGTLSLRQGKTWPPDLGITVLLFAQQGEDLAGKTVVVGPERPPPVPRVILRWKDEQGKAVTKTYHSGYALRVVFGQPVNGRMPGEIYIALPDEEKSFAAGTIDAEIRKAQPPRPKKG